MQNPQGRTRAVQFSSVLAGLDPAIQVYAPGNVDARIKHGLDGLELNDPERRTACRLKTRLSSQ
jgi:hypothetical protein